MVVCNAVNVEKICGWLRRHAGDGIELENITMTTVLLALQGPKAQRVLQSLTSFDVSQLRRFRFVFTKVAGVEIILSRTGYTGEDGFELFITDEPQSNPERGEKLWNALLRAGEGVGIKPCGLGARNTTRLEAGMCLYGHELTEEITPLEAHLDFVVKFEKGGFIGRAALLEQKAKGLSKLRVGLRMLERGIPRKGHEVFRDASKVGFVTSGTFSPLLKTGIAMAYLNPQVSAGEIEVEIHGKRRRGQVVNFPFYDPNEYGARRKRVA
jgi:aminomethyltransferase